MVLDLKAYVQISLSSSYFNWDVKCGLRTVSYKNVKGGI